MDNLINKSKLIANLITKTGKINEGLFHFRVFASGVLFLVIFKLHDKILGLKIFLLGQNKSNLATSSRYQISITVLEPKKKKEETVIPGFSPKKNSRPRMDKKLRTHCRHQGHPFFKAWNIGVCATNFSCITIWSHNFLISSSKKVYYIL